MRCQVGATCRRLRGSVRPEALPVPGRAAGLPLPLAPAGSGSGLGGGSGRGSAVTHHPPFLRLFPAVLTAGAGETPQSRSAWRKAWESFCWRSVCVCVLVLWERCCGQALSAVCSPGRSPCCISPGARSWRGCAARPSRCLGRSPLCSSGRRSSRSIPGIQQVALEGRKETWLDLFYFLKYKFGV